METRANTIRDALEQEIISGVRFPGERLDEPQLTRQFTVSRTPVREALVELATSGLVEMRPYCSAVVAEIGAGHVIQMYEVLAELEGLSARLAVRRMTRDQRSALAAQHASIGRLIKAGETDEFPALNKTFHGMIHAGAHNDILSAEIDGLNKHLSPYRRIYREEPLDLRIPYEEHDGVVAAMLDRDEKSAEQIFRDHTALRADHVADFIAAYNRRFERRSA
jgi:DNA-binding GntR family transcriptional regulator